MKTRELDLRKISCFVYNGMALLGPIILLTMEASSNAYTLLSSPCDSNEGITDPKFNRNYLRVKQNIMSDYVLNKLNFKQKYFYEHEFFLTLRWRQIYFQNCLKKQFILFIFIYNA